LTQHESQHSIGRMRRCLRLRLISSKSDNK
jgi:hypothetical protein